MYVKKKDRQNRNLSLSEIKDGLMAFKALDNNEVSVIEKFSSLLPAKIKMLKDDILSTLIISNDDKENQKILDGLKSRLDALSVLVADKQLREQVVITQYISKDKVLLPGVGSCYIERGIIATFIADITMLLYVLSIELSIDTPEMYRIKTQIQDLHLIFTPKPTS